MILGCVLFSHWKFPINPCFNDPPPQPHSPLEREVGTILLARLWAGAAPRAEGIGLPCASAAPQASSLSPVGLWVAPGATAVQHSRATRMGQPLLSLPTHHPRVALGLPQSPLPAASELGTLKRACSLFYSNSFCPCLGQYPPFHPGLWLFHLTRVPQNFKSAEIQLLFTNHVMDSPPCRSGSRSWRLGRVSCQPSPFRSYEHHSSAHAVLSAWNTLPAFFPFPTPFILQHPSQERWSRKPFSISLGGFNLSALLLS